MFSYEIFPCVWLLSYCLLVVSVAKQFIVVRITALSFIIGELYVTDLQNILTISNSTKIALASWELFLYVRMSVITYIILELWSNVFLEMLTFRKNGKLFFLPKNKVGLWHTLIDIFSVNVVNADILLTRQNNP